jgi:hypothetical protein
MYQTARTACCPDGYYCPNVPRTVCPRHTTPLPCCSHPELHHAAPRAVWHQEQEREEQAALLALYREAQERGARREPAGADNGALVA